METTTAIRVNKQYSFAMLANNPYASIASGLVSIAADDVSCTTLTVTGATTFAAETVANLTVTNNINTATLTTTGLATLNSAVVTAGSTTTGSVIIKKDTTLNANDGATSHLRLTGATVSGKEMYLAYDTVNDYGIIQAVYDSILVKPIKLNWNGGAVSTKLNTLDDGTGNVTTAGYVASPVTTTAVSKTINSQTTIVTAATGVTLTLPASTLIGMELTVLNCDASVAVVVAAGGNTVNAYGLTNIAVNSDRRYVLTGTNTYYST